MYSNKPHQYSSLLRTVNITRKMPSSIYFAGCLFLILTITYQVNSSEVSTCFQQRCRECPESAITEPVYETKCEIRSLVSQSWLDLEDHSIPGPQGLEADYACLKLTAYDPTMKTSDSTDVIKGCILKQYADRICDTLVGVENSRGKTMTKCTVCNSDLCNGAFGVKISVTLLIIGSIISFIMSI